MTEFDAVVVGAGPNGLTAAVTLASVGLSVLVLEAADTAGGGARTGELTLPGFQHDSCSAVHPLAAGSPVLRAMKLEQHGLTWIYPELALAHPFPDGSAAILARSAAETASFLDGLDRDTYLRLVGPFTGRWDRLAADTLRAPLTGWPADPAAYACFALLAAMPAAWLASGFTGQRAKALIAGLAGHLTAPLTTPLGSGVALLFALAAHETGWPVPRGGSQAISDALTARLVSLGGRLETGQPVRSLTEVPSARVYLLDTSPGNAARIAGDMLPRWYRQLVLHRYRYGPAVFKADYALSGPVPWTAPAARRAGTVHLGSSMAEIGAALTSAQHGRPPSPPFLITAQPSLTDDTRAPSGSHVFWAYAQVPNGWRGDLTTPIEDQIERFAPGFRDLILARLITTPGELEARNPNNAGGDIAGGRSDRLRMLLRPIPVPVPHPAMPYATPNQRVYLCSSATPPGPGVHGMCGYHAAQAALRRVFRIRCALAELANRGQA
jgi:phytoene dehydrogenase-like protein